MREKVLVLVRATPQKSRKHGFTCCVAGINEKGELRRLYPFKFSEIRFRKKQWVEAEIAASSKDKRKESAKVIQYMPLPEFVDDSELASKLSEIATSVDALKKNGASLGVVKPELLGIEVDVMSTQFMDEQTYFHKLETASFALREKVKMPVKVRYTYRCSSGGCSCAGKPHKQVLIDWEANELARNLMHSYDDKTVVRAKLKEKLFDWMKQRDVFFVLGTHFKYKTWMIIGIYYFRKGLRQQKTLGHFWQQKGDTLQEIESITSKLSREQALELVRKAGR